MAFAGLAVGDVVTGRAVGLCERGLRVDIGCDGHELFAYVPNFEAVPSGPLDLQVEGIDSEGRPLLAPLRAAAAAPTGGGQKGRGRGRGGAARAGQQEPPSYGKERLLRLRALMLREEHGAQGFPALQAYSPAELDAALAKRVSLGDLPPSGWRKCSRPAKRAALLAAIRAGHMAAVFAMQPRSESFREELDCQELDAKFLGEAMAALCGDAAAAGKEVPAKEPTLWLLEHGAPAAPLLPGGKPVVCLAGLRLLGHPGPHAVAAAAGVLPLLNNQDVRLRKAAAETLGLIGESGGEVLGGLWAALRDADFRVQQAAAVSLGQVGEAGLAVAAKLLRAKSAERQGLAVAAIAASGALGARHTEDLLALLATQDGPLRLVAAQALGSVGPGAGEGAAAALAQCTGDSDEYLREAAVAALGRLGPAAAGHVAAITAALDDSRPFVQEAASVALQGVLQSGGAQ